MLGYIAGDESVSYTKQELETVFADKYINEYDAFGKRLQEQIVTGTIEKTSDGRYRITDKGKSLIAIYDKITDWFLIDKKLVHPDVAK
jgi:predicted transcriptional regulator